MDTIQAIMSRTSTRDFLDKPIGEEDVRTILKAGMSGPSAVNARPWSFIVVRDRETLGRMADGNGPAAEPLRNAALGILVCGDLERAFQRAPDFWIVDGSIAAQNMILAAHDLGIGSVWLGTWPMEDKVRVQAELFSLPESIVPHSIIAFGYPAEVQRRVRGPRPEWEENRVHYERW